MKIVAECDNRPSFKPYTLKITVNTQEEHDIMRKLASSDVSVPGALYPEDAKSGSHLAGILYGIHETLIRIRGVVKGETDEYWVKSVR